MAEPIGTVGMTFYFGAESAAEGEKLGLDVLGLYCAGRGGVVGEVEPAEVDEVFYFFKPGLISGMLVATRATASREAAIDAHLAAADAYARLHGLGCVMATWGPGGLKLVNTTAQAWAENSPVVVVSGAPGLAERAGDDIDAAARRETDEYAHGTRWIRLCVRVRCRKADNGERRDYDTNR